MFQPLLLSIGNVFITDTDRRSDTETEDTVHKRNSQIPAKFTSEEDTFADPHTITPSLIISA